MSRRSIQHVFANASRLLLAVALLFATGPWSGLLAASRVADCVHMMSPMQHGAGSHHCHCVGMSGDHDMPNSGKHGSTCSGDCAALCAVSGFGALPAEIAFTGLQLNAASPLPRFGVHAPSLSTPSALRPPISI
ncbi:MAG: hypothetical protein COS34_04135 [Lysobacterales bacterium CG02_land_8_20_14_3_00_62_12]|nr:MAG: hypothetical protein COS34_04135 [Xanthomonadales bacterium CG02_land_8_20_14_3_00_62_12]PJA39513.1 MAG: hypothetical protein CO182_09365 [Xanthomonadales bacterium CG_4_9_14_3_um_filter_62_6]